MSRTSGLLFLGALLLLLASFAPWPVAGGVEGEAQAQPEEAAVGQALFQAKGCVACHRHDGVPGATGGIGPDLSRYRPNPAFVGDWLRDPGAIRPNTPMPDLDLSDDEIEALIAFLDSAE